MIKCTRIGIELINFDKFAFESVHTQKTKYDLVTHYVSFYAIDLFDCDSFLQCIFGINNKISTRFINDFRVHQQ